MASPRGSWALSFGLLCITGSGYAVAQDAAAQTSSSSVRLHIASQPLPQALTALATQTGVQLVYHPEDISAGVISPAVSGSYTPDKALTKILDSSGLSFYHVNSNTIAIRMARADGTTRPAVPDIGIDAGGGNGTGQVTQRGSSFAQQVSAESEPPLNPIAEVVVTAEKREERLQDVPVPVTAISAATIINAGQVQLQQYATRIPGLNVTPDDFGAPQLTICGLSSQGANPTVAVVVDDVPFGSSTGLASGAEVPDIDPNDLARVEVLRGPQGTLYGASSLGGLLKFVTVDPSTDAFSGHVQAGTGGVYNGAEPGYNFRASVNVPLSDTLAVRASGFTRQDPGYVDNPLLGIDGVNESHTSGGRLSALWRPFEDFSVKLSALYQDHKADGLADVLPTLGDLKQEYLPGVGEHESKTQAYSATVAAKLGVASLTAVTGYSVNDFRGSVDFTSAYGPFISTLFGVPGTEVVNNPRTSRFTQEVRLSVPLGDRLEWLVGGFYDHEYSPSSESILALNPATGGVVGTFEDIGYPSVYSEYAGFSDLTVRISDQFDVQIGGRESENRQSYQQSAFFGAAPVAGTPASTAVTPKQYTDGNAFTYLVTPRLKLTPDLMLYARFASGYRPGGPNYNVQQYGLPPSYSPDKTLNYEVGFKGDLLDQVLTFDTSVYYIDWRNIQLTLTDPVSEQTYFANAGNAKSEGVELSGAAHPLSGLTIAAWVAWNNAKLTEDFPGGSTAAGGAYGVSGERLPNTSRFSGNVSIDDEFPVTSAVVGMVGASMSYVGDSLGIFQPTAERQVFPAYARTDLRAGARYESWLINFFVNNLADKRAVVGGGLGYYNPADFQYIQPRTVGVFVDKKF
jgi:iron complex outermembrane recepter protein